LYSEIISLDEFKELNMKEKLLFTFGENWRNKYQSTSIAKTNKYTKFNYGVKVDLPLLTEFENF
jgi:hypothetical protein